MPWGKETVSRSAHSDLFLAMFLDMLYLIRFRFAVRTRCGGKGSIKKLQDNAIGMDR